MEPVIGRRNGCSHVRTRVADWLYALADWIAPDPEPLIFGEYREGDPEAWSHGWGQVWTFPAGERVHNVETIPIVKVDWLPERPADPDQYPDC